MHSDTKKISEKEITSIITAYCSKQERCTFEIAEKLKEFGISESSALVIIEKLKADKFIDDARYAKAFVNDKFRFNKWGRSKIAYALKSKQIPGLFIEEALLQISDKEYNARFEAELGKKLKTIKKGTDYEIKAKLYRFALSRGFESDLIMPVIEKIFNQTDN